MFLTRYYLNGVAIVLNDRLIQWVEQWEYRWPWCCELVDDCPWGWLKKLCSKREVVSAPSEAVFVCNDLGRRCIMMHPATYALVKKEKTECCEH